MLKGNNNTKQITMNYKDYGLTLPLGFKSEQIQTTDKILFIIYKDQVKLEKEFTNLQLVDGEYLITLEFTKQESEELKPGNYSYTIKQYRDGELLNTIINNATFTVESGV